ncbi:MAG: putative TIM-barrel fold metal-dependent hydrolase [Myxococcota bacterium]|jgi:predicted TIM-barrel fold metal-dependent hydrolase
MRGVIIDSHAHLDSRLLDVDLMCAKMDEAGVDRAALIPCMNDPIPETPERLLSALRIAMQSGPGRLLAEGIHRMLLTSDGDLKLSGQVIPIYPQPDNQPVADALLARPDRFYGWMFLNPAADERVLESLERWRAVPGMIGIKLHPHWHDYKTEILGPLLGRAEELGLPILIHLGFRKRGDFRHLCDAYPRLKVIAAHAGFPFYKALWAEVPRYHNLHVDLSSPYIDEKLARSAVAALGPRRCLYGTDSPYGFECDDHSYNYRHIRGWIDRLPIADAERDAIFGGNFQSLLQGAT